MAQMRLPREQALENDLILELVFKLCNFHSLGNCRQISKTWYTPATKVWKSRALASICPDTSRDHKVSDFLKLVSKSDHTKPFVNWFLVRNFHTDISKPFWEKCGNFVKTLYLKGVTFQNVNDFRHILYVACPNMEEVILEDIWLEGPQFKEMEAYTKPKYGVKKTLKSFKFTCHCYKGECTSLSWTELFSHFAHIEKITVRDREQNLDKIFQALQTIRQKDSSKLKLKHIEVSSHKEYFPAPPALVQALNDPTIPLETLIYDLEWNVNGILRTALATHAKSLKKLTLYGNSRNPAQPNPLDLLPYGVKFENFQELHFYSNEAPLLTWLVSFLHYVPNLRRLTSLGRISSSMVLPNSVDMENGALLNFKEVDIAWETKDVHAADGIHHLTSWMPNLTRLAITNVTNKMFEKICANLPHLVYLELNDCHMDDCGLTGLDPDQVKQVNRKRNGWRPITAPRANLTSLKHLVTFSCSTKTHPLTYCAGACGVEQLPELLFFIFDIAPKLISKTNRLYWRTLAAKINAKRVTPNQMQRGKIGYTAIPKIQCF